MEKIGSGLTMLVVGGSLVATSVIVIAFLLILSGFLTFPSFLTIALTLTGAAILGCSIAAAVLSRRRG